MSHCSKLFSFKAQAERDWKYYAKDHEVLITNFLLQVRKKNREQYKPTSLRSFVSSFNCYLRKEDYFSTIMDEKEFQKTKIVNHKAKGTKERRERK